jgi:hypothetical protein
MRGGGIYKEGGALALFNCTLQNNVADDCAGGWFQKGGDQASIINCNFINNMATGYHSRGSGVGGMLCGSGGSVQNSIFQGNTSYGVESFGCSLQNNLFFHNGEGDCRYQGAVYTGAVQINTLPNASDNLDGDPLFVSGRYGNYYLSQKAAGQSQDSPGVNTGSDTAVALGLDQMFTRTDGGVDTGIVDMGRHYSADGLAENYRLTVSVNGGHGTISPSSGFFASNSVVQLQATPEAHYFVKKWTGTDNDSLISTSNTVTMLMDRRVSVEFEFGYQIQRQVDGQGSVTTSSCRGYFTPGEQTTIKPFLKPGGCLTTGQETWLAPPIL